MKSKNSILASFTLICILTALFFGAVSMPKSIVETAAFSPVKDDRIIFIDPGHGGEDSGALAADGTEESELNLSISMKLKDMLALFGVQTEMTREEDISVHSAGAETLRQKKTSDLKNRVAMINEAENSFLVSVHQNFFADSRYSGAQVFFSADDAGGAEVATRVQEYLRQGLDPENKRRAAFISDSVYLMKNKECSGILVECGFLSNAQETEKLKDKNYQSNIAASIAAGVMNYYLCN